VRVATDREALVASEAMWELRCEKLRRALAEADARSSLHTTGLRIAARIMGVSEGAPPVPNTKEQNIAFRKAWDAYVAAGLGEVPHQ